MRQHLGPQLRLLIVEDNEGDARLLTHMLQEAPGADRFDVKGCRTLSECFVLCEQQPVDLILLDLGLPESTGIETVRAVRNRFPAIPVVVLTGLNDDEKALAAVREGAEEYITKQEMAPRILARTIRHAAERHELKRQLHHMATHDPVTGLFNRHHFNQSIQSELDRSIRYRHPIGFVMLDVNRFKEINDRYGHQMGDQVLRRVAGFLCEQVRAVDLAIRYGGDEFLLVLAETDGGSRDVAARIRREARRLRIELPTTEVPVALAVGDSYWAPDQERSIEQVLAEADRRMYEDKRALDAR